MPAEYLHRHQDFPALIRIVAVQMQIDPALVEKDYWIMHCLFGLQAQNIAFELKGGTSLSKGFQIIDRFSEDIDVRIDPPSGQDVKTGRNQTKPAHVESRDRFYDWLVESIRIDGITDVRRDPAFENATLLSGGIRLLYRDIGMPIADLKAGILLEVGFDDVTPNHPRDISSWAYDYAATKIDLIDNRAKAVSCYDPGYTLVEKLQAISTKFRKQQETQDFPANFLRHYYDVYCLLRNAEVQAFVGSAAYKMHKTRRFPKADNQILSENEAFLLRDAKTRAAYADAYARTPSLYYKGRPSFDEILTAIETWLPKL
jgi:hypothetical protein